MLCHMCIKRYAFSNKIEDDSMEPSSRPGPVLGHFMFKKVFLPKDRLVLVLSLC